MNPRTLTKTLPKALVVAVLLVLSVIFLIPFYLILRNALRKRSDGVPTYSVPEAAALLSVSQEHLYRLIRADAFPAVRMRLGQQGRYVVPARAVEALLDAATGSGCLIDVESATATFAGAAGGQQ